MSLIDIKALNLLLVQIEEEKRISREKLMEALENALAAAYKKDFGKRDQIIRSHINIQTGDVDFTQIKTVVDETSATLFGTTAEKSLGDAHSTEFSHSTIAGSGLAAASFASLNRSRASTA